MIGGFARAYNLTFDYVLYNVSFINILMYSNALPTYSSTSDNTSEHKQQHKKNVKEVKLVGLQSLINFTKDNKL